MKVEVHDLLKMSTNEAGESGGALFVSNSAQLYVSSQKMELSLNCAVRNGGSFSIENGGVICITNGTTTFVNNRASNGGAIHLYNTSTLFLYGSQLELSKNLAQHSGGAVAIVGESQVKLGNTTIEMMFTNNTAQKGGALQIEGDIAPGAFTRTKFFNNSVNTGCYASFEFITVCPYWIGLTAGNKRISPFQPQGCAASDGCTVIDAPPPSQPVQIEPSPPSISIPRPQFVPSPLEPARFTPTPISIPVPSPSGHRVLPNSASPSLSPIHVLVSIFILSALTFVN